jgi:hypothetical protein
MELLLAIIGLILTILLSGPAVSKVRKYRELKRRKKWSADIQVKKGLITEQKDYAFETWQQVIEVNKQGDALHSVDARIVNIGTHLLRFLSFPVYCDATNVPEMEVNPWARYGRHELVTHLEQWDTQRARGRIRIDLDPPISLGKRIMLSWGYCLPRTFKPGDEYYNWDISTPHYELGGELQFDPCWRIVYLRWEGYISGIQPSPTLDGSNIIWYVLFPKITERITMRFGLEKR